MDDFKQGGLKVGNNKILTIGRNKFKFPAKTNAGNCGIRDVYRSNTINQFSTEKSGLKSSHSSRNVSILNLK